MSGRILIIDTVATNRILLKVRLEQARYQVTTAGSLNEARLQLSLSRWDLIVIDMSTLGPEAAAFTRALRRESGGSGVPIIGIGRFETARARRAVLEAGADEVLAKPLNDTLLRARIRSLLRARETEAELRFHEDTNRALGFAEPEAPYDLSGAEAGVAGLPLRMVLLSAETEASAELSEALEARAGQPVPLWQADSFLAQEVFAQVPDVVLIDARPMTETQHDPGWVFRLIADLRSRTDSRHTAQLVLTSATGADAEIAAMALDMGANDTVTEAAPVEELHLRLTRLAAQKLRLDRLRATVHKSAEAAITCPLTGLHNRRYALAHTATLLERHRQNRETVAVLVLDVDHFKSVNDRFGHAAGDQVLQEIAARLRDALRPVDLIARIGGEEFLVVIPRLSPRRATETGERLRQAVEGVAFALPDGHEVTLTISVGVTTCTAGVGAAIAPETLIARADQALYDAKGNGRNQVRLLRDGAAA